MDQMEIVKNYPSMVRDELQNYDEGVCKFFEVGRNQPVVGHFHRIIVYSLDISQLIKSFVFCRKNDNDRRNKSMSFIVNILFRGKITSLSPIEIHFQLKWDLCFDKY
jgi:hypothetical protein